MSMTMTMNELMGAVQAALAAGDTERAGELARQGVNAGIGHPNLLALAAHSLWTEGRPGDALPMLLRARDMSPRDANIQHLMGLCYANLGYADEATAAYEAAIAAEPNFPPPYFNFASLKHDMGDIDGALALYRKAAALDPNYAQAMAAIADLDAKAGRFAAAREAAAKALAIDPAQFAATSAIASANLAEGKVADAEQVLRASIDTGALSPLNQAIAENLLADVLDAQDRTTEAFEAYQLSKLRMRAIYTPEYGLSDTESALTQAQRLAKEFEAIPAAAWEAPAAGAAKGPRLREHVFLLGFPRSGTTLLEQVLANHPLITTLEETNSLGDGYEEMIVRPGGMDRLAYADARTLERLRASYWERVEKLKLPLEDRVVVDKLPINTVMLPLIVRLFPDARILFARRDPRDVVLSCFRRRIAMNSFMFQLLTLEGAARYYDAVMDLASAYIAKLPLKLHVVRYEEVVADFEREIGSACRFMGVDWSDALKNFAASAVEKSINTPSAAQVARGLYREGVGQWRRYAAEMASVLPILEPWVEQLGYSKE